MTFLVRLLIKVEGPSCQIIEVFVQYGGDHSFVGLFVTVYFVLVGPTSFLFSCINLVVIFVFEVSFSFRTSISLVKISLSIIKFPSFLYISAPLKILLLFGIRAKKLLFDCEEDNPLLR